jgi:hypothetical protein
MRAGRARKLVHAFPFPSVTAFRPVIVSTFIARKPTIIYPDTGGLRSAARRLAFGLQESLQALASRLVYKTRST